MGLGETLTLIGAGCSLGLLEMIRLCELTGVSASILFMGLIRFQSPCGSDPRE